MKIYDITQTIETNMYVYKEKPEKRPTIQQTRYIEDGGIRESRISLDVHTGTHLDAPMHMLSDGKPIESIPLEALITNCRVLDFTDITGGIEVDDLNDKNIRVGEVLLLKTRNSFEDYFNESFIYLASSAAEYLADIGIKGVCTDGLGIERSQPGHITHRILFEADVFILEGLRLKDIRPGYYQLIALPLKLKGVDAAPVRAVLIDHT
jgi:arylformamidase